MEKENLYKHAGWIAGGFSREAMFDSLRLHLPVQVDFILNTKEIISFDEVFVTSINVAEGIQGEDWIISLHIIKKNKKNNKENLHYYWTGTYSTRSREGKMIGDLPKCLFKL